MYYKKYVPQALTSMILGSFVAVASAQNQDNETQQRVSEPNRILQQADENTPVPGVSPARRIVRDTPQQGAGPGQGPGGPRPPQPNPDNLGYRSIDGSGNNLDDPDMGKAHIQLLRQVPAAYADGIQSLAGPNRPSARAVSNAVVAQSELIPNSENASDFIWQWGQFLDHDIDLTDGIDPPEPANIAVPAGDIFFDPQGTGVREIELNRSLYDVQTGSEETGPRQQINEITAWIDASNVYGSDEERAAALRTNDGSGRLKSSDGNLLPFNEDGLANAGGSSAELFLAGDVRANEQLGLTAMHTLFMREHNWHAERIRQRSPQLSGEEIYQRARQMVGAEMQVITYEEYLPALLGRGVLSRYRGYQSDVNASIANIFSTALFRYGHSALSPNLLRLDAEGNEIEAGHLPLRNAFFVPHRLATEGGIEPMLRGLAAQVSQQVDNFVIDDVRNFLFGPPGSGGFDLPSLNIQRGRDHGLPSYNNVRRAFGLRPARNFSDVSSNPEIQNALASVYDSVDDVDLWVGGLAEDILEDALVGELIATVLRDQFEALRDGDRFWYERALDPQQLDEVRNIRLSDIIRRNTTIGNEISNDVFHVRQRPGNP
ncbi:peroxidase family protein [Marinicella sp. W31]|uniref:peroxidase family protein n=1 Tax=Marinicella sp. W31 TaxID=3023713 RepID=UPI0037584CD0